METEEIGKIIEQRSYEKDGKIKLNCSDAFSLAEENELSLSDISRYCNQNNIRISKCQLGCFS